MSRPPVAIATTPPPATAGGAPRRSIASTMMKIATATSATPWPRAARISARVCPKVRRESAGRSAMRMATNVKASALTSDSMWAGVRQQRERAGPQPAHRLHDHVGRGERQHPGYPAALLGAVVVVRVVVHAPI